MKNDTLHAKNQLYIEIEMITQKYQIRFIFTFNVESRCARITKSNEKLRVNGMQMT